MSDDASPVYAFQTRARHTATPSHSSPNPGPWAMQASLSLSSNSSSESEGTFIRKYKENRLAERLAQLDNVDALQEVSLCRAKVRVTRNRSKTTAGQARTARTSRNNATTLRRDKRPRARTLNSSATPKPIKSAKCVSPRQSFTSTMHIDVDIEAVEAYAYDSESENEHILPTRRKSKAKAQTPIVGSFDAKLKSKRSKKLKRVREGKDSKDRKVRTRRKRKSKTPRTTSIKRNEKSKSGRRRAATPTLSVLRQRAFAGPFAFEEKASKKRRSKSRSKSRSRSKSKSKKGKKQKKVKKLNPRKSRPRSQTVAGWKPPSWLNTFDEDEGADFLSAKPFHSKESLRNHKHAKASVSVTAWNSKNHY